MKIKFKEDKATILKLLKTANIKKRLRILDKLNGVNERDSIKILLKVLEDSSWTMREKAARRLAQYGNRVVPRLEKLLNRGYWFTRASACLSLGEIGNLKALKSIVPILLTDDNPTVVKEASAALIKMARKKPLALSEILQKMSLDASQMAKILKIIEEADADVFTVIKETVENE